MKEALQFLNIAAVFAGLAVYAVIAGHLESRGKRDGSPSGRIPEQRTFDYDQHREPDQDGSYAAKAALGI